MSTHIDNTIDVIDSRDVIERIKELKAIPKKERDERDHEELRTLKEFRREASEVSDWEYGETFIRDDYFEDYAQQLAEDVCEMPRDYQWPFSHIDWKAAAEALQQDYTSYEFDGVTYWARY